VAVAREGEIAGGIADGSARVDYTGSQLISLNSVPTLSARLRQGLAPEAADTEKVDFSKVAVSATFSIYPAACGTTCPTVATYTMSVTLANASDWSTTGAGAVSLTGPSSLAAGTYLVVVTIGANAWILPQVAESTLTVGTPSSTFVTGGGYVATDSTANAPSRTGLFGFNAKNGSTPAGSVLYVYRVRIDTSASPSSPLVPCTTLSATCRDVDVLVRTTALSSMVLGSGSPSTTATVVGTAAVQFVDAANATTHYAGFEFSGASLRIDVLDSASGSSSDKFGLTVYRSGAVFHQAYIPATSPITQAGISSATNQVVIGGGAITLHS
jgi:hypothetical protein